MNLSNLLAVARKIDDAIEAGISLDEIDSYPEQLRALTVDDVNAAIKKYFDPAKLVTVIAGTTQE